MTPLPPPLGAVPQPLLLLEQINAVASQFEAALVAQQADREGERARASEAQRLREEQDAALQASLRADQEKEKQRLEAERREREAAEAERRKAEEVEQAARVRVWREKGGWGGWCRMLLMVFFFFL